MIRILTFLFVLACAGCNPAWAGLPPTTIKGQTGSKATTFNFQVPANQATLTGPATALIETGSGNLLANPGFEAQSVASGWTISNGTPTGDTSTEFDGLKALLLAFTSVNGNLFEQSISDCDKYVGQNLEATIYLKTSTSDLEVCTFLGSNELQCSEVATTNVWQPYTFNIAPSSGQACTIRIRTTTSTTGSLGADAAYLGLARNIGTVAQAEAILLAVGTGSTQSIADTTATKVTNWTEAFDTTDSFSSGTLTVKKPGYLKVEAQVRFQGLSTPVRTQLSVYKNGSAVPGTGDVGATTWNSPKVTALVQVAVGDTIELYIYQDSAGSSNIDGNSGAQYVSVTHFPSQSELAIRPQDAAFMVDANISGANPSLGTSAVTSYTEITNGSLTLTPASGSAPVGIMCSSTNAAATPSTSPTTCSAGSESVGFNVAVPRAGDYQVCGIFSGAHTADSGESVVATFQFVETATNAQTIIQEAGGKTGSGLTAMTVSGGTASNVYVPHNNCGILKFNSAGTKGIRLMYEQSILGSPNASVIVADGSTSDGQRDIRITMRPWLGNANAPLLVGSLTNNSSSMFRFEAARVTCAASSSVDSTTNSGWVTVGNASGGNCALTFSPVFSSTPWCFLQSINGTQTTIIQPKLTGMSASGGTLTSAQVSSGSSTIAAASSTVAEIICIGPK